MSAECGRAPTERGAGAPAISGVVLAGGRSRRMGGDKCWLDVGGRTLLQRVINALEEVADEIVVVGAPGTVAASVRSRVALRHVADPFEDGGPLVAIAAGLEAARAPVVLVLSCDLPFLDAALLRLLAGRAVEGARLVVPVHEGRPQLLCSAWRRDALAVVRERLAAGDRAVHDVIEPLAAELLPPEGYAHLDAEGRSFLNVNTPEQLAEARRRADGLVDEAIRAGVDVEALAAGEADE